MSGARDYCMGQRNEALLLQWYVRRQERFRAVDPLPPRARQDAYRALAAKRVDAKFWLAIHGIRRKHERRAPKRPASRGGFLLLTGGKQ